MLTRLKIIELFNKVPVFMVSLILGKNILKRGYFSINFSKII